MEPAPTIYDVARRAGVSASTVSRTFARPGRVGAATAAKVRAAAAELDYRGSAVAPAPARGNDAPLVVTVPDLSNPVFHGILRGAQDAAGSAGKVVLACDTRESGASEREAVARCAPYAAGLVLAGSRMSNSAIRLLAKTIPVVVLNRTVPGVPSLVSDQAGGAHQAVTHLHELGHRRIAYLAGPEASWTDGVRWRGIAEASSALGVRVTRTGPLAPTIAAGRAAVARVDQNVTGLIAYNDLLALGVIRELVALGRSVPADLSVIGFDDSREGGLVSPALTTVAAPLEAMGRFAVQCLLRFLRTGEAEVLRGTTLPTRLVLRQSTGHPSRNNTSPASRTTRVSGSAS